MNQFSAFCCHRNPGQGSRWQKGKRAPRVSCPLLALPGHWSLFSRWPVWPQLPCLTSAAALATQRREPVPRSQGGGCQSFDFVLRLCEAVFERSENLFTGLLQSTVNVRPLIFLLAVNDANHDYPFSTRKTVNWNDAILCIFSGT
jgi:hypothetical protein